jgi:hypothetical protein
MVFQSYMHNGRTWMCTTTVPSATPGIRRTLKKRREGLIV